MLGIIDTLLDSMGVGESVILPSQIPRSRNFTAESRLYYAVLEDAIRIYKCVGGRRKPGVRDEVMEWFWDDTGSGPFSFRGICEALNVNPDAFRERIKADSVGVPMRRQASKAA